MLGLSDPISGMPCNSQETIQSLSWGAPRNSPSPELFFSSPMGHLGDGHPGCVVQYVEHAAAPDVVCQWRSHRACHAGTQYASATAPAPAPASPRVWSFPPVTINGVNLPAWSLPKWAPAPPAPPLGPAPAMAQMPQVRPTIIITLSKGACRCHFRG